MKNNVIQSWKTTLIGMVIIIASVVSVFFPELNITWYPDALAGIGIGILLWFSPDKLLGIADKRLGK